MPPPSLSLNGRRTMWRSRVLVGLLVLGSGSSARAMEPQTIVGDWVGEWRNGLGVSDAVYMTVTKGSGGRVEGTVSWRATPGAPSENHDLLVRGRCRKTSPDTPIRCVEEQALLGAVGRVRKL